MSFNESSSSNTRPNFVFDYYLNEQKSNSNVLEKRQSLINEIEAFWRENTIGFSENFDAPVSKETFLNAKNFILMLPLSDLPSEVIAVSGKGHIGFDWNNPDGRTFTAVITGSEIYFAALLNKGQRLKGSLNFNFVSIPNQILDAIGLTFSK